MTSTTSPLLRRTGLSTALTAVVALTTNVFLMGSLRVRLHPVKESAAAAIKNFLNMDETPVRQ